MSIENEHAHSGIFTRLENAEQTEASDMQNIEKRLEELLREMQSVSESNGDAVYSLCASAQAFLDDVPELEYTRDVC